MDDYLYKRSGQIPAFGDWENANEMPITQYFEGARQAGLLRYSSSSGDSDPTNHLYAGGALNNKHSRTLLDPSGKVRKARERRGRGPQVKGQTRQQQEKKVCNGDVTTAPRKPAAAAFTNRSKQLTHNDVAAPNRYPKAVDEDLYKIPPEMLHSSKRKKIPGLFACLVPACAS